MSTEKVKLVVYTTAEAKNRTKERAKAFGMDSSAFVNEVLMWEARHELLSQLRKGGSIICNGKET
ncbi:MAG: hypothetical protein ACXABY_15175 [Candidatus Thorarchaeota archaeon]|jgi:hypothetical protein